MAKYTTKLINQKKYWEDFVKSKNPKSFLQSWNWGETNELLGNKIIRLGFYKGRNLIGVCLLIKQVAKRGTHFLIPAGPVIDWGDSVLVDIVFREIKQIAFKEGAWFVRIRPEVYDSNDMRDRFKGLGLVPAPIHLHAENTWVLDIGKSEEEILSGMRKNTRYSVKKSLSIGLNVRNTTAVKDAKILSDLQKKTVERHGFIGFSPKLFSAQIETFGKDKEAALFVCEKDGKPLVAGIINFYGDYAYYHHSASSKEARGVPASYFFQWEVIKEAKSRGYRYYNFWGIAPNDNPNHRFAGVTIFKKGFGGERVDWLHAHDMPISSKYWLTYIFESLRRFSRGL